MANTEGAKIEALKALSGVESGEGYPLSSRLGDLGEHRGLPQWGAGRSSGRKRNAFFGIFLGHRTLLADRKIRFVAQCNAQN